MFAAACFEPVIVVVGAVDAVGFLFLTVGEGDYVVAIRVFVTAELEGASEAAHSGVHEEYFAQSVGGAEVAAAGIHVLDVVGVEVVGPESGGGQFYSGNGAIRGGTVHHRGGECCCTYGM